MTGAIGIGTEESSAFSDGALSVLPYGKREAKPRSKNVVHLLCEAMVMIFESSMIGQENDWGGRC